MEGLSKKTSQGKRDKDSVVISLLSDDDEFDDRSAVRSANDHAADAKPAAIVTQRQSPLSDFKSVPAVFWSLKPAILVDTGERKSFRCSLGGKPCPLRRPAPRIEPAF